MLQFIVTISQAAKMAGISRTQLYRGFINKGKISVIRENDKVCIDVAELIRVFPNATIETSNDVTEVTIGNVQNTQEQSEVVTILKQQLAKAEAQIEEAKKREEWLKQQIDELRKQQNNLLEDKTTKKRKKLFSIF